MRHTMFGRLRVVLAVVALGAVAACSRDLAGPRDPADARSIESYTLPEIDAYGCRYGGQYPACEPAPTSGGPETQSPGNEPTDPSSGGYYPPPDSTTNCDPQDPKCEQPLTSADSTTILNALRQFIRPDTAIHDTTNRRLCNDMHNRFMERFNAKKVYRGAYDTQGGTAHYGATWEQHIHFDPWLLGEAAKGATWAQRELVNTALHEAAHVIGYLHPNGPDANGHYIDSPFNLLDSGPNVCNS